MIAEMQAKSLNDESVLNQGIDPACLDVMIDRGGPRSKHRMDCFDWISSVNEIYGYHMRVLDMTYVIHDLYATKV